MQMQSIARTLIAATLLTTLSATVVCAQATDTSGYGTWSDTSGGSNVVNGQVNLQTQWSNLNTVVDSVGGDAALQGAAAGNLGDIMTMNNTVVNNSQFVGLN